MLDFCLVARSITNLTLLDVPFVAGALLLSHFPHLRQLSLYGQRNFDSSDPHSAFLLALTASTSLEHLTIDNSQIGDDGYLARLPDSWKSVDWVAPASPKASNLDIGHGDLEQCEWRLVEGTSSSLERLTLVMSTISKDDPPVVELTPTLPHLHTCHLFGDPDSVTAVLSAFAASSLTTLSLTFGTTLKHFNNESALALALQPHLPNLKLLTISLPTFPSTPRMGTYRKFCDARGIAMRTGDLRCLILDALPLQQLSASHRRSRATAWSRCDAMDEVLQFAVNRVVRLRLNQDVTGVEEMLPLFKGWAARMVLERD